MRTSCGVGGSPGDGDHPAAHAVEVGAPPAGVSMSETRGLEFDGHHLAYRVTGEGPALVVLSLYRRREDMIQARVLSDRWQVFQIIHLATATASGCTAMPVRRFPTRS